MDFWPLIGAVLGLGLLLVAYPPMRERLDAAPVPTAFRGNPIKLINAGLVTVAFLGLAGLEGWYLLGGILLVVGALSSLEALLDRAKHRVRARGAALAERIDALLPQTQCGQCGFPGCRPYAEAIARGEADINQCPPGGAAGVRALAELLGVDTKPLNPEHGIEKPPRVALVREAECIGCTKCIQACPVDAILGASKHMHTVLAELCTGCELCLPPCPVDCIDMVEPAIDYTNWRWPKPRIPSRLDS